MWFLYAAAYCPCLDWFNGDWRQRGTEPLTSPLMSPKSSSGQLVAPQPFESPARGECDQCMVHAFTLTHDAHHAGMGISPWHAWRQGAPVPCALHTLAVEPMHPVPCTSWKCDPMPCGLPCAWDAACKALHAAMTTCWRVLPCTAMHHALLCGLGPARHPG